MSVQLHACIENSVPPKLVSKYKLTEPTVKKSKIGQENINMNNQSEKCFKIRVVKTVIK